MTDNLLQLAASSRSVERFPLPVHGKQITVVLMYNLCKLVIACSKEYMAHGHNHK